MDRSAERILLTRRVGFAVLAVFCIYLAPYRSNCPRSQFREHTLKNDLFVMRQAIDTYTLDKQKPPQSLQDLVDAGYLPRTPIDPFTEEQDWALQIDDVALSTKEKARGLRDVHSSSTKTARNGTPLSSW